MSVYGPFLPFTALHQFDRSWGRSGHCVNSVDLPLMTHLGSGVCIAACDTTFISAESENDKQTVSDH